MDQIKIVVFVPKSHADVVRKALGDAGAEGANPTIGQVGKFEEVAFDICPLISEEELLA